MIRLSTLALVAAPLLLAAAFAAPSAAAQEPTTQPTQEAAPQAPTQAPAPDSDVIVGRGDTEPPPVIDQVDRVVAPPAPGERGPLGRPRDGVRTVQPGALLFASFDGNHDGRITPAEFEAGAAASFAVADKNSDGQITGFEQTDWANAIGTGNDILANPMTFDADLDRNVTQSEFVTGLRRIAASMSEPRTGDILFSQLIQPLRTPEQGGERAPFGPAGVSGP